MPEKQYTCTECNIVFKENEFGGGNTNECPYCGEVGTVEEYIKYLDFDKAKVVIGGSTV